MVCNENVSESTDQMDDLERQYLRLINTNLDSLKRKATEGDLPTEKKRHKRTKRRASKQDTSEESGTESESSLIEQDPDIVPDNSHNFTPNGSGDANDAANDLLQLLNGIDENAGSGKESDASDSSSVDSTRKKSRIGDRTNGNKQNEDAKEKVRDIMKLLSTCGMIGGVIFKEVEGHETVGRPVWRDDPLLRLSLNTGRKRYVVTF